VLRSYDDDDSTKQNVTRINVYTRASLVREGAEALVHQHTFGMSLYRRPLSGGVGVHSDDLAVLRTATELSKRSFHIAAC